VTRERPGSAEVEVEGRTVRLTNLDKVLFPQTGFTKGDLIDFYARVADVLLPHLHGRPLTLKRHPDSVVNDLPTLLWAANLADIELHTSLSLAGAMERPTAMVFDLDPGPPADMLDSCQVALWIRGMLSELGLETFVKTSGSEGVQVYVPLNTDVTYERTKPFAREVARTLEQQFPDRIVSRTAKKLPPGKVLVDWSQNDEYKSVVCAYSVRAQERPTVSTPLRWEEVERALAEEDRALPLFDVGSLPERLEEHGDLFAPVLSERQELPEL
jgi:bifunctional non-homologous end joining protein LigD